MRLKGLFDLTGRTALVTGSARGIGRGIALGLAEYGAKVIVHGSRPSERLDEALALVRELSPESIAMTGDLSNPSQVDALPCEVDILIANASIEAQMPWDSFDLDEMRREYEVNTVATLRLFQRAYPHMKSKRWGRMISVGSVQERRPHPAKVAYAASKGALENIIRNVARQVAADGITVNNLCPGVFATDRNKYMYDNLNYKKTVLEAIPMHWVADPVDAAGAAVLLASDAGRYITGTTILIDGGLGLPR